VLTAFAIVFFMSAVKLRRRRGTAQGTPVVSSGAMNFTQLSQSTAALKSLIEGGPKFFTANALRTVFSFKFACWAV
jgi:hypothetical protein